MSRRYSIRATRFWLLAACLMGIAIIWTSRYSAASNRKLDKFRIESVHTGRGITGRSLMPLSAGVCVVMHYPPMTTHEIETEAILRGDQEDSLDDGAVVDKPLGYWGENHVNWRHNPSMFNCATFAIGDVIGLTGADWIEPFATSETEYTVPARVILDSYFKRVAVFDASDWSKIEQDESLLEGDVLAYAFAMHGQEGFVHFGKITKWKNKNNLLSKIGFGPIIRSSVKSCATLYQGQFTELHVYRRKTE